LVNFANSTALKGILSGLRPVVVALILGAAVIIGLESVTGAFGVIIVAASIVASWRFKINPAVVILVSGFLGILVS
jgi:chromate transporter